MMKKPYFTILFTIFISILSAQIYEQKSDNDIVTDKKTKTYILADIQIKGIVEFSKSQILHFAHLNIGDQIIISGNKINYAVKELWNTNIFSDISIYASKIDKDQLYLDIYLKEFPKLSKVDIKGIKKSEFEKILENNPIKEGTRITEDLLNNVRDDIRKYYSNKGYPEAKIYYKTYNDNNNKFKINLDINIKKGNYIKISKVIFEGNKKISDNILLSSIEYAKKKNFFISIFSLSKYDSYKFKKELKNIIEKYQSLGFRDASIISYNVWKINKENYGIKIKLKEGQRYYLGNVSFIGNTVFNNNKLKEIFTYKKGAPYDFIGIRKKTCDKQDDNNILSAYLDRGNLFSEVNLIEKVTKDPYIIDLDIDIHENEVSTLNKVTFSGNTITKDHVIMHELLIYPGDIFSKKKIKYSLIKLAQLGFFKPEKIILDILPNPSTNYTDINWDLTEKSSSQIQLQGGYGNGQFIGTIALKFTNFSLIDFFKKNSWNLIIPQGDAEQLSLSSQIGYNLKSYSFSFTEPYIGASALTSLSFSINYSTQNMNKSTDTSKSLSTDTSKSLSTDTSKSLSTDTSKSFKDSKTETDIFSVFDNYKSETSKLSALGISVNLIRNLNWPYNNFSIYLSINYDRYFLKNITDIYINKYFLNGKYNDLNYLISFRHISIGPDILFPTSGSDFNITGIFTFPYSFFDKKTIINNNDSKWVEYYKLKIQGNWYKEIYKNIIARIGGEFGFLGNYNSKKISSFQRFFIGGVGLLDFHLGGRDYIPLRGYPDAGDLNSISSTSGDIIYNKFLMELRYPLLMNNISKIWALFFAEAGNSANEYKKYKPFELKRSAGIGVRLFISVFGLIGIDFGYGFDHIKSPSKWEIHFIMGKDL